MCEKTRGVKRVQSAPVSVPPGKVDSEGTIKLPDPIYTTIKKSSDAFDDLSGFVVKKLKPKEPKLCSVENCSNPSRINKMCRMHFERFKRNGNIELQERRVRQAELECSIEGCRAPCESLNLCKTHYKRQHRTGSVELKPARVPQTTFDCSVIECSTKATCKGLCKRHYERLRTTGSLDLPTPKEKVERQEAIKRRNRSNAPIWDLFWSRVIVTDFCWLWSGNHDSNGYSLFSPARTRGYGTELTHKFFWERLNGPVPEGKNLDHIVCDNVGCVAPWHLSPETPWDNTKRGSGPSAKNARKTHCSNGHPYSDDNLYEYGGNRYCKTCKKEQARVRAAKNYHEKPNLSRKALYQVGRGTLDERFDKWTPDRPENDCWLWKGGLDGGGYGIFSRRVNGGTKERFSAHRFSYEKFVGPIPEGLKVDHLCRVHDCVSPSHLEAVTTKVNTERGSLGRDQRTRCKNGHEYTEETTKWEIGENGLGYRICRVCARISKNRSAQRLRDKRKAEGLLPPYR